jgi:predicted kinase
VVNVPALVILRGNSASGKSTVARRVQVEADGARIAVIGQDQVRRELLNEEDNPNLDTIGVVELLAEHCLDLGRTTIVEGIYKRIRYGEMFDRLRALAAARDLPVLIYYLDVGLEETIRRHAGKPIAGVVTDDDLRSWYRERDLLDVPGEQVLGESMSEDVLVERILADLGAASR